MVEVSPSYMPSSSGGPTWVARALQRLLRAVVAFLRVFWVRYRIGTLLADVMFTGVMAAVALAFHWVIDLARTFGVPDEVCQDWQWTHKMTLRLAARVVACVVLYKLFASLWFDRDS